MRFSHSSVVEGKTSKKYTFDEIVAVKRIFKSHTLKDKLTLKKHDFYLSFCLSTCGLPYCLGYVTTAWKRWKIIAAIKQVTASASSDSCRSKCCKTSERRSAKCGEWWPLICAPAVTAWWIAIRSSCDTSNKIERPTRHTSSLRLPRSRSQISAHSNLFDCSKAENLVHVLSHVARLPLFWYFRRARFQFCFFFVFATAPSLRVCSSYFRTDYFPPQMSLVIAGRTNDHVFLL